MYQFFREMGPQDKVIIFFGKKAKVDDVSSDMAIANIDCQSIHGGREQQDREQALEDLKTGAVQILLATDVASRGIDIEDITYDITLLLEFFLFFCKKINQIDIFIYNFFLSYFCCLNFFHVNTKRSNIKIN